MEESNPVQTAGIREFLAETMAEEFDRDSFYRVAAVVSSSVLLAGPRPVGTGLGRLGSV